MQSDEPKAPNIDPRWAILIAVGVIGWAAWARLGVRSATLAKQTAARLAPRA